MRKRKRERVLEQQADLWTGLCASDECREGPVVEASAGLVHACFEQLEIYPELC